MSRRLLDAAREKSETSRVENFEFVRDGIVRYTHEGETASFVFSKNTLHHLPDFWKIEALETIGETLEPGGFLRFRDLVYSFDPPDSHENIRGMARGNGTDTIH